MRVYLVRHGDAVVEGEDHERVLSPRGREAVREVALKLIERGARPGKVIASPLSRARETAEIISAAVGAAAVETDSRLLGDTPPRVVGRLLTELGMDAVLCSHEPLLGALVAFLTEQPSFRPLKKAELVCVEIPAGKVVWSISPSA